MLDVRGESVQVESDSIRLKKLFENNQFIEQV